MGRLLSLFVVYSLTTEVFIDVSFALSARAPSGRLSLSRELHYNDRSSPTVGPTTPPPKRAAPSYPDVIGHGRIGVDLVAVLPHIFSENSCPPPVLIYLPNRMINSVESGPFELTLTPRNAKSLNHRPIIGASCFHNSLVIEARSVNPSDVDE